MPKQQDPPIKATGSRYDFTHVADGQWWRYDQGVDFAVQSHTFRSAAYQWAGRNGYTVDTRKDGQSIFVRFTRRAEQ